MFGASSAVSAPASLCSSERDARADAQAPVARTLNIRRMSRADLAEGQRLYPVEALVRPRTRSECAPLRGVDPATRKLNPCPFVSCRHHLYLDVNPVNGSIKLNFGDIDLAEMPETCSLDVAERGELPLSRVAVLLNVTRERVRQIEAEALAHLSSKASTEPPPCASWPAKSEPCVRAAQRSFTSASARGERGT